MKRLGISFAGGLAPPEVVECARLADDLGYDSVWVTEGNGGDHFTILTACAMATSRVRLGTSVSSVYVRSAPTIAMAAACVDHFSRGRFILGLGSSHKVQVEGQYGLAYSKPLTHLRESVEIIRQLLRNGWVSYSGEVFNIERFQISFEPYRQEIPVYLAAVYPKMLKVCGQIAQGTVLTRNTPQRARESAKLVAAAAREAGRNPSEVDVASLLIFYPPSNGIQVRNEVRQSLAFYCGYFPRYNRLIAESGFPEEADAVRKAWLEGDQQKAANLIPDEMVDALTITGDADECLQRVEEHRSAGVTLPILSFPAGMANARERIMETIRAMAPG